MNGLTVFIGYINKVVICVAFSKMFWFGLYSIIKSQESKKSFTRNHFKKSTFSKVKRQCLIFGMIVI